MTDPDFQRIIGPIGEDADVYRSTDFRTVKFVLRKIPTEKADQVCDKSERNRR